MPPQFNFSGGIMPGFSSPAPAPPAVDYSAYRWPKCGNYWTWTLAAMLADVGARDFLKHLFPKREAYYRSIPPEVRAWIAARLEETP